MTESQRLFEEYLQRQASIAENSRFPGFVRLEDYSSKFNNLVKITDPFIDEHFGGPLYIVNSSDPSLPSTEIIFAQTKPEDPNNPFSGNTAPLIEGEVDTIGGGETDYHLLYNNLARLFHDAIIAGGNSDRMAQFPRTPLHPYIVDLRKKVREGLNLDSQYHHHPLQVSLTLSGNLDLEQPRFNLENVKWVIITTDQGYERLKTEVSKRPQGSLINMGPKPDLPKAFRELKFIHHVSFASIIGGRTIATEAIEEGLVTGAHVTTAVEPGGKPNTPFYVGKGKLDWDLVVERQEPGTGIKYQYIVINGVKA